MMERKCQSRIKYITKEITIVAISILGINILLHDKSTCFEMNGILPNIKKVSEAISAILAPTTSYLGIRRKFIRIFIPIAIPKIIEKICCLPVVFNAADNA